MSGTFKDEYFETKYLKDFRRMKQKIEVVVNKYKQFETTNSSSPSAPDTSKFIASHSGSISSGVNRNDNIFYVHIGYNVDEKIKEELVKELDNVIEEEKSISDITLSRSYTYGTNYSPYKIYWNFENQQIVFNKEQYEMVSQ